MKTASSTDNSWLNTTLEERHLQCIHLGINLLIPTKWTPPELVYTGVATRSINGNLAWSKLLSVNRRWNIFASPLTTPPASHFRELGCKRQKCPILLKEVQNLVWIQPNVSNGVLTARREAEIKIQRNVHLPNLGVGQERRKCCILPYASVYLCPEILSLQILEQKNRTYVWKGFLQKKNNLPNKQPPGT